MYEHCGVIGVFSFAGCNIVPKLLVLYVEELPNLQEALGIAIPGYRSFKRSGIVSQSVEQESDVITELSGSVGIAHVRYSTTGESVLENDHPLEVGQFESNDFYIVHNGILERELLFEGLSQEGCFSCRSATDTELMGIGLYKKLKNGKSWVEAFETLNPYLNGSFSTVILTAKKELICARDEKGFRPLCLGWHEETSSLIIASESCALDAVNAKLKRDIHPGEMIRIDTEGLTAEHFAFQEKHAYCPFEYTYFAHPTSCIDGTNIYLARKNIGRVLTEKYPIETDIVVPVPDSARPAALGYSEMSGIPF